MGHAVMWDLGPHSHGPMFEFDGLKYGKDYISDYTEEELKEAFRSFQSVNARIREYNEYVEQKNKETSKNTTPSTAGRVTNSIKKFLGF